MRSLPNPGTRTLSSAISSRSVNDKYRPDNGAKLTVGIPPPSLNHRTPTGSETPAKYRPEGRALPVDGLVGAAS